MYLGKGRPLDFYDHSFTNFKYVLTVTYFIVYDIDYASFSINLRSINLIEDSFSKQRDYFIICRDKEIPYYFWVLRDMDVNRV
jgi:hypothetical protein